MQVFRVYEWYVLPDPSFICTDPPTSYKMICLSEGDLWVLVNESFTSRFIKLVSEINVTIICATFFLHPF